MQPYIHLPINASINVKPYPPVWGGWGFDLTSNQSPYPGAEMGDQIPQLSPHTEVRKIGGLTLYIAIAYENTWNSNAPPSGRNFALNPLVMPHPSPYWVGLNIDRCIKCYMYIHSFL